MVLLMQFPGITFHSSSPRSLRSSSGASTVVGCGDRTPTGPDIGQLDAAVCELFSAGLAPATLRSYRSGCGAYTTFCDKGGWTSFPASERVMCYFVAALHEKGIAGSSAKSYLAAIRYTQIALGMGDPHMSDWPRLGYVPS